VGISGYVWNPTALLREAPPAARHQRALVTHGRRDTVVPCGPVRDQIEELKAGGLSVEWHEFDKAHTVAGEPEMALIRDFLIRGFRRETSGKA
jgi:predicted esterase